MRNRARLGLVTALSLPMLFACGASNTSKILPGDPRFGANGYGYGYGYGGYGYSDRLGGSSYGAYNPLVNNAASGGYRPNGYDPRFAGMGAYGPYGPTGAYGPNGAMQAQQQALWLQQQRAASPCQTAGIPCLTNHPPCAPGMSVLVRGPDGKYVSQPCPGTAPAAPAAQGTTPAGTTPAGTTAAGTMPGQTQPAPTATHQQGDITFDQVPAWRVACDQIKDKKLAEIQADQDRMVLAAGQDDTKIAAARAAADVKRKAVIADYVLSSDNDPDEDKIPSKCEEELTEGTGNGAFPALNPRVFNGYQVGAVKLETAYIARAQEAFLNQIDPQNTVVMAPAPQTNAPGKKAKSAHPIKDFWKQLWNGAQQEQPDLTSKLNMSIAAILLAQKDLSHSSQDLIQKIYDSTPKTNRFAADPSAVFGKMNATEGVAWLRGGSMFPIIFNPLNANGGVSFFVTGTLAGIAHTLGKVGTMHNGDGFLYIVDSWINIPRPSYIKILNLQNVGARMTGGFFAFLDGNPILSDIDMIKVSQQAGFDTAGIADFSLGAIDEVKWHHFVVAVVGQEQDAVAAREFIRENIGIQRADGTWGLMPQEYSVTKKPDAWVSHFEGDNPILGVNRVPTTPPKVGGNGPVVPSGSAIAANVCSSIDQNLQKSCLDITKVTRKPAIGTICESISATIKEKTDCIQAMGIVKNYCSSFSNLDPATVEYCKIIM